MVERKRAFTLIEILVVVAIIALLISILLPSLKRARMQAKNTVCMSYLKQQGYAAMLYANDNKGTLPGAYGDAIARLPYDADPSGNTAFRHPFISVYKMAALAGIFYCPANDIKKTPWTAANFFMHDPPYGNGGDCGRITYWWLANPPPHQYYRYRDTNGVDKDGNPGTAGAWTNSDPTSSPSPSNPWLFNDECMVKLDQRWSQYSMAQMKLLLSPDKVAMSTDGSAQKADGWRFFHGDESLAPNDDDTTKLSHSWKNTLYGDLHVASVKSFKVIERWGPNNPAGW